MSITNEATQARPALPLLALCGLSFRHIMGFLIIFFMVTASVGSVAMILSPMFF